MEHYEKIEDENKRLKDKLQDLKDQLRRDNLGLVGLENMRMNRGMIQKKF